MRTSILWIALLACGDDETPVSDAGRRDGGGGAVDSGSRDGGGRDVGGGSADGGGGTADGGSDAGGAVDAGGAADAGPDGCPDPLTPESPLSCYRRCSAPADCMWVDSDCCCNCANGGGSDAISSRYAADYAARRAAMCPPRGCDGVGCLAVYLCPEVPPTCVGGYCTGVAP
jgi:hypothetical protein